MKEDFVPYELAVKLKEKGFKEKCYAYYFPVNNELCYNINQFRGGNLYNCLYSHNSLPKELVASDFIDAPTIPQVLEWLREEKKIHLIVEISDSGWYYTLYPNIRWENGKLKSDKYFMSFKHNPSYEFAALAAIEYCLDNLI